MVCAESVVNENGVPRRPVQFTPSGHIVGMLDRDIRTTKPHYPVINCQFGTDDKEVQKQITMCHSVRRQHTRPIKEFHYRRLSHELVVPGRETKCISRINGPNYVYQSFQRLKQVLFVGVYLLTILSIPRSLSAPMNKSEEYEMRPWWFMDNFTIDDNNTVCKKEFLENIVNTSHRANNSLSDFIRHYFDKSTSEGYDGYNTNFKDSNRLSWLPLLKDLVPHEESKNIKYVIPAIYEQLQTCAVGMQVIMDRLEEPFAERFKPTIQIWGLLLLEARDVASECNIQLKPNVTKNIANISQSMTTTERDYLFFVIMRDSIKNLDHIQEILPIFYQN